MAGNWQRNIRLLWVAALCCASAQVFAQGAWKQGPPIPQGANEVIGGAIGGSILVYGGQDATSKPMGIFWKFDPGSGQWTQLPSNPVPVHHGTSATVEAQLVAQQPVETRVVYVQAEQPAVVYAAPMVPRQVNIYAGLHAGYGVNYQVPVYQAQCTSGYYLNGQYPQGNCYNAGYYRPAAPGTTPCNYSPYSAGIVLRRPGRGY